MTRTHFQLALLLVLTLIASCKKKEDSPPVTVSEYTQLKPGNYWIYESYLLDMNYNGGPGSRWGSGASAIDSVYVLADTTMNGRVYHQLSKPILEGNATREIQYLSDSLSYLVDQTGRVVFALEDSSATFLTYNFQQGVLSDDSALIARYKLAGIRPKATPAGTFAAHTMAFTYTYYPYAAQARPVSSRAIYTYYTKGIGIVAETLPFYASEERYVERRLLRYRVQ